MSKALPTIESIKKKGDSKMAYIVSDTRYKVRFSNDEWNNLLRLISDLGFFDKLPEPELDQDWVKAQIAEYETEEERNEKANKKIAEWNGLSKWEKYHPEKGQMAVVSGIGAKKWLDVLESSHLDDYFGSKEKQRKNFIDLCEKGEFRISYKSEEQA